jgi:hypothetical protein
LTDAPDQVDGGAKMRLEPSGLACKMEFALRRRRTGARSVTMTATANLAAVLVRRSCVLSRFRHGRLALSARTVEFDDGGGN